MVSCVQYLPILFIFVQDPVSVLNGSFNDLLNPLRIVFVCMNPETLSYCMFIMVLHGFGGQLPATTEQITIELQGPLHQLSTWQRHHLMEVFANPFLSVANSRCYYQRFVREISISWFLHFPSQYFSDLLGPGFWFSF